MYLFICMYLCYFWSLGIFSATRTHGELNIRRRGVLDGAGGYTSISFAKKQVSRCQPMSADVSRLSHPLKGKHLLPNSSCGTQLSSSTFCVKIIGFWSNCDLVITQPSKVSLNPNSKYSTATITKHEFRF